MTDNVLTLETYKLGDNDNRPWGGYVVTAVGENYCEKTLTIEPNNILSLQSHAHRREHWKILEGDPVIILDGETLALKKGDEIAVPSGALHAMANLSQSPVVFHERQDGTCSEDDITRYIDAYGRAAAYTPTPLTEKSVAAYKALLEKLRK